MSKGTRALRKKEVMTMTIITANEAKALTTNRYIEIAHSKLHDIDHSIRMRAEEGASKVVFDSVCENYNPIMIAEILRVLAEAGFKTEWVPNNKGLRIMW